MDCAGFSAAPCGVPGTAREGGTSASQAQALCSAHFGLATSGFAGRWRRGGTVHAPPPPLFVSFNTRDSQAPGCVSCLPPNLLHSDADGMLTIYLRDHYCDERERRGFGSAEEFCPPSTSEAAANICLFSPIGDVRPCLQLIQTRRGGSVGPLNGGGAPLADVSPEDGM